MEFEYPGLVIDVDFHSASPRGFLFLVTIAGDGVENVVMIQNSPPPGVSPMDEPPTAAFASAALKAVTDMRRILAVGLDQAVQDIMRLERRFSRQDEREKTEMMETALAVAESVGDPQLAEAQDDLEKRIRERPKTKKRKTFLGAAAEPKTAGARELVRDGFTVVKEISLVGKGPGLWYEVLEPPGTPKEWSPRGGMAKDQVLMLRQKNDVWHTFYKFVGTGSGGTPRQALTGGLGDVIDFDSQIEAYCNLVLAAPARLAQEYDGLYSAQGSCFADRSERD